MEANIEIPVKEKIELCAQYDYRYEFREGAIILGAFITFVITLEIVLKFIFLRRRRKQLEQYVEQKLQEMRDLKIERDADFWLYIRKRLME